jgi:hypothetical protein
VYAGRRSRRYDSVRPMRACANGRPILGMGAGGSFKRPACPSAYSSANARSHAFAALGSLSANTKASRPSSRRSSRSRRAAIGRRASSSSGRRTRRRRRAPRSRRPSATAARAGARARGEGEHFRQVPPVRQVVDDARAHPAARSSSDASSSSATGPAFTGAGIAGSPPSRSARSSATIAATLPS